MRVLDSAALAFVAYTVPIPIYALGFQRFPHVFRSGARLLTLPLVLYALWLPTVAVGSDELLGRRGVAVPVAGATLGVAALALLTWARWTIGARALSTLPQLDPVRYPQPLVARGPYARARHPRYLGYWLLGLGLALATGLIALWAVLGWLVAGFGWLAALEERELVRRFGAAYVAYQRRVPRFLVPIARRRSEVRVVEAVTRVDSTNGFTIAARDGSSAGPEPSARISTPVEASRQIGTGHRGGRHDA